MKLPQLVSTVAVAGSPGSSTCSGLRELVVLRRRRLDLLRTRPRQPRSRSSGRLVVAAAGRERERRGRASTAVARIEPAALIGGSLQTAVGGHAGWRAPCDHGAVAERDSQIPTRIAGHRQRRSTRSSPARRGSGRCCAADAGLLRRARRGLGRAHRGRLGRPPRAARGGAASVVAGARARPRPRHRHGRRRRCSWPASSRSAASAASTSPRR